MASTIWPQVLGIRHAICIPAKAARPFERCQLDLALVDCRIAGESLHWVYAGGRTNIRIDMHKSKMQYFHSAGLLMLSTRASQVHEDVGGREAIILQNMSLYLSRLR